jgi:hypothetical protein
LIGIAVGLLLLLSLTVAHFFAGAEPLKITAPLDVEDGLPFPWIGHASSIFSLTALFGAYLTITIIVGLEALVGLALGSIAGLVFLRGVVLKSNAKSFELFLRSRKFSHDRPMDELFFVLLALAQAGFAISELVILRDL